MTTTNKTAPRALASLKLPRVVPALILYMQAVIKGMTANPYFPTPTPPIATLQSALDDLQAAQTSALARTKGAVATRNSKRAVTVTLLEEVRTYVQSTADANPENGIPIIESAGLTVRKTPLRVPLGFHAKAGAVSGLVKIVAPAGGRRASYEWQYSADGGKTWVDMPGTLQAKTTLSGQQPQATLQFRYRVITKTGQGNWSAPISFLVV